MSLPNGEMELTWRTIEGERFVKAANVVSILLELEANTACEDAQMILWILAQVFGVTLDENPADALNRLRR